MGVVFRAPPLFMEREQGVFVKVKIETIDDCQWDSEELFPESHCHNTATHVDRVSGFVFCAAHSASFEALMNDPDGAAVLEARYHARNEKLLKLANEKSPVPAAPEKVVENDSDKGTGSQDVPGAETPSVFGDALS
jgi:hypothetical protein